MRWISTVLVLTSGCADWEGAANSSPSPREGTRSSSALLMPSQHPSWPVIEPFLTVPQAYAGDFGNYASLLVGADGGTLSTPAQWAAHRQWLRDYWLATIGTWPPEIVHPTLTILDTVVTPQGVTRHRVEVEPVTGVVVTGYLLIPPGPGPFPAVVDLWYFPIESVGLQASTNDRVDFSWQLAQRGFVALAMPGIGGNNPAQRQPLSYLAYVAGNLYNVLADRPEVDPARVGIVGHSFGGKWALFGGALNDKFAAVAVSDPDIVWDESHANANYWEAHYLGYDPGLAMQRMEGVPTASNPRTGAYKILYDGGHDLTELHALIAPRPFFVAGGGEDKLTRWKALNRTAEVYALLGAPQRVGLSSRPLHEVSAAANEQVCAFFESFLESELFDAGVLTGPDGGADAGEIDAGEMDAGEVDSGVPDAGELADAGQPSVDAGQEKDPLPGTGCGCASGQGSMMLAALCAAWLLAKRSRGLRQLQR